MVDRALCASINPPCNIPHGAPFAFVLSDIEVDPPQRHKIREQQDLNKWDVGCEVFLWGRADAPHNCAVHLIVTGYRPRFFVQVGEEHVDTQEELKTRRDAIISALQQARMRGIDHFANAPFQPFKRTDGYHRRRGVFLELDFDTVKQRSYAASTLRREGFHALETNISEEIQFLSRNGILAQGWVQVRTWSKLHQGMVKSNVSTALSCTADLKNICGLPDKASIGAPVAFAFDIETISREPPRIFGKKEQVKKKRKEADTLEDGKPRPRIRCLRKAFARPKEKRRELEPNEKRPMPYATNPKDEIIAVSITAWVVGRPEAGTLRHVICQKQSAPVDPEKDAFTVEGVADEKTLLRTFCRLVRLLDPDLYFTFNGNNYDVSYMVTRAIMCGAHGFFTDMARAFDATRRVKTMPTAQGDREWYLLEHAGRTHCDLYDLVQRMHNVTLRSYKLNNVAKNVLKQKEGKVDLPYQVMFRKFEEGTPEGIYDMCKYADMDTYLLKQISDKLNTPAAMLELCRVSGVPLRQKLSAGQQAMTSAQLYSYMHKLGYVMMPQPVGFDGTGRTEEERMLEAVQREATKKSSRKKGDKDSFKGGCVIEPIPGLYVFPACSPIFVLDFAALYPSIIQAFGFDFSTVLYNPAELDPDDDVLVVQVDRPPVTFPEAPKHRTALRPDPVFEPVLPMMVKKARDLPRELPPMTKEMWFCRNVDKPSLPETLRDTVATRKRVQAEAEALVDGHPDKIPKDARQKALKILSNSHYGAVSVLDGKNPCRRAGICTPLIGGWMLKTITNAAEAYWPVDVVYGDTDSIMYKFKLEGEVEHCNKVEDLPKVLAYGFALGDRIAKAITGLFPRPVKLEVEKAYSPYAIGEGKKRYAGRIFTLGWYKMKEELRWEPPIEIKGLENKRRDNCEYFLDLADTLFDCVMKRNDPQAAIEAVRQTCEDTLEGRVPVSKLVISQSLSKTEYKNPPAHAMVAMRRAEEDPGAAVGPGERVEYVICEPGGDTGDGKGAAGKDVLGNRCFMPDEVEARELKPDMLYYIENKLIVPITKMIHMLELGEEPVRMMQATIKKLQQRRDKVATLDSFFAKAKVDEPPAVKRKEQCGEEEEGNDRMEYVAVVTKNTKQNAVPAAPTMKRSKTLASFFKRG